MFKHQQYTIQTLAHIKGNHLPEDLVDLMGLVALFFLDLPKKKGKIILLIHTNNDHQQLRICTTQQ